MSVFTNLEPAVYQIVTKRKDKKSFDLKVVRSNYVIDKKLYGAVHKLLPRITRLIELGLYKNISVLASGRKGLGKTTAMNSICNLLIQNNIPVIEVKYIDVSIELIEFLSNFRNVAIYIDEFGKYFSHHYQDKILTLLNKEVDFYRIFILGENDLYKISNFILDRMERAKYHLHLDRIQNNDLEDYCKDNNLPDNILSSLLRINATSNNISYDTLENITEEHKIFPELTFDELTGVLNCHGIIGVPVVTVLNMSIVDNDEGCVESFRITTGYEKLKLEVFQSGNISLYVTFKVGKTVSEKDTEETPKEANPSPFGYNRGVVQEQSVRVVMSDVISINDLDNTMTAQVSYNNMTFEILLGSNIIPNN